MLHFTLTPFGRLFYPAEYILSRSTGQMKPSKDIHPETKLMHVCVPPRAVGWVGGLQIMMSIVYVASVASVRSRSNFKCEEVAVERREVFRFSGARLVDAKCDC